MAKSWNIYPLHYNEHSLAQIYMGTGRLSLGLQMAENAHDHYKRIGMSVELSEVVVELLRKLPLKWFQFTLKSQSLSPDTPAFAYP